ncbi:MAG: response regulator [Candidatus Methylomirabilales bacterium]
MEPIKIVIADDHESVAEALHVALEREDGLRVLGQACTIDETLVLLRKTPPNILLLDLALPDGNGWDLVPLVRNQHPEVRVLLFTSFYTEQVAVRALRAGARGCISKGERLETLLKAIRAVYRGEIWAPRRVLSQALEEVQSDGFLYQSSFQSLTDREREICRLVARGETNKEIASKLFITEKTVKSHLNRIFRKLHLRRRIDLALHQGNRKYSGH